MGRHDWRTRDPRTCDHPWNMELLGFAAVFVGLALLAALPLVALLALAGIYPSRRSRRER